MPNDQSPIPAVGETPEKSRQLPGTPESAAEFRAFLAEIGETATGFSRTLKRMGDDRERATSRRRRARQAAATPAPAPKASGGDRPASI